MKQVIIRTCDLPTYVQKNQVSFSSSILVDENPLTTDTCQRNGRKDSLRRVTRKESRAENLGKLMASIVQFKCVVGNKKNCFFLSQSKTNRKGGNVPRWIRSKPFQFSMKRRLSSDYLLLYSLFSNLEIMFFPFGCSFRANVLFNAMAYW